jgi:protein ImuB
MRVCAVYLPSVRVEIAQRRLDDPSAPLAVVVARRGGAVQKETDLLGNTRIDEVSAGARAFGVRPGQTIAAARAKRADLRVRVVAESAVAGVLASICEAALAFGATTAAGEGEDVVWVDVTGCGHLFGGEEDLLARLLAVVASMGHEARGAVADGPRIAAAMARFAPAVVPPGENAAATRPLPVRALPLDFATCAWLENLGVRTVGDLQRLPRESLALRLGAQGKTVMALLEGDDRAPLSPYQPPDVVEERAELEYGIESTEALLFVVKSLCDRAGPRLEGRGMAATRLELVLGLDRAMVQEGASPRDTLAVALPSPLARPQEIFAVLRAKLEGYVIAAPILTATLRAPKLSPRTAKELDLFVAEAKGEHAIPRLVAELAAELGDVRVGLLALMSTWMAEERTRLVPFGAARAPEPGRPVLSAAPEPTRLLREKKPLRGPPPGAKIVARLEAVEWWKRGPSARDVLAAWTEPGGVACIEVDRGTGRTSLCGWFD